MKAMERLKLRPKKAHNKYNKKVKPITCPDCDDGYVDGKMCRRCQGTGRGKQPSVEFVAEKVKARRERQRQRARKREDEKKEGKKDGKTDEKLR